MDYSCPAVQAGHALAEYLIRRKEKGWMNETLVFLGVETKEDLKRWCKKLDFRGIEWFGFHEPDYNNELTAIAVLLCEKQSSIFKKLDLF